MRPHHLCSNFVSEFSNITSYSTAVQLEIKGLFGFSVWLQLLFDFFFFFFSLSTLVDSHLNFFLPNFQTLMQRQLVVGARPGRCHTITVAALSRAALVAVRALQSPVPA